jgi:hypothetical protein
LLVYDMSLLLKGRGPPDAGSQRDLNQNKDLGSGHGGVTTT